MNVPNLKELLTSTTVYPWEPPRSNPSDSELTSTSSRLRSRNQGRGQLPTERELPSKRRPGAEPERELRAERRGAVAVWSQGATMVNLALL